MTNAWPSHRLARRFQGRSVAVWLGVAVLAVACSDTRGPTSPTSTTGSTTFDASPVLLPGSSSGLQIQHILPGGTQIDSFDTTICELPTDSFVSGTEVCAKATGLGGGRSGDRFDGFIRWFPPGVDVNNVANAVRTTALDDMAGSYQDRYTPLECGTWTLKLYHTDGGNEVFTATFEVTDCVERGCSHGYWKNHQSEWQGYAPGDTLGSIFTGLAPYGLADETLAQALDFTGGPDVAGALQILLRNAVASLLNAAHAGVDFPMTEADVINAVDAAIASGDRDTILDLEADLDVLNNLGCPLS